MLHELALELRYRLLQEEVQSLEYGKHKEQLGSPVAVVHAVSPNLYFSHKEK